MYGYHDLPVDLEKEGISISMERVGEQWVYRRKFGDEEIEKLILGDEKRLIINPVEPLNTPKEITPNLLIEFEKTLLIGAGEKKQVFLTFPVEIGIFISEKTNKNLEILDVLSLVRQKFTLYGEVSNGVVCKYWKSRVYTSPPDLDPLQEGVLELTLRNSSSEWAKISKAVFSAYGMKLYYDGAVFMKARMDILNKNSAETSFEPVQSNGDRQSSLLKSRKEAFGVYGIRKLGLVPLKFYMGWGL